MTMKSEQKHKYKILTFISPVRFQSNFIFSFLHLLAVQDTVSVVSGNDLISGKVVEIKKDGEGSEWSFDSASDHRQRRLSY